MCWVRISIQTLLIFISSLSVYDISQAMAQSCWSTGLAVQALGSGGPELQDRRASASYLIWDHGTARVIVDAGGGSAKMSQVDAVLSSQFRVDHSGDLPSLIFSSSFEDRKRPLPIFAKKQVMPSTPEFVRDLFSEPYGAWRYLNELPPSAKMPTSGEGDAVHAFHIDVTEEALVDLHRPLDLARYSADE
jgi:ribonuclease BN (tRNA processing enzyme)